MRRSTPLCRDLMVNFALKVSEIADWETRLLRILVVFFYSVALCLNETNVWDSELHLVFTLFWFLDFY